MSRSLGLREDQREGERLVVLICELFTSEPVGCHRERIESSLRRSHLTARTNVGAAVRRFDCPR